MIGGVTIDAGGKTWRLRMNTRAMMGIETTLGKSIADALDSLSAKPNVSAIVKMLSECMNDGAGADISAAQELVDLIGFAKAGEALGEAATAAFPEADTSKKPKNAETKAA